MLRQAITFANDKGGVGKTTLAVNVVGMAAAAGWRCLLVDLDPQGDCARDLGVRQQGLEEGGSALAASVFTEKPISEIPFPSIRPKLDLISAGAKTREMREILQMRSTKQGARRFGLADALSEVAGEYDLIVIDTPPVDLVLQGFGLAGSHFVVVPVKHDDSSVEGIARLGDNALQFGNPGLELMGVALFDFEPSAKALRASITAEIEEFLKTAGVFPTAIRRAVLASREMRTSGLLAVEHEDHVQSLDQPKWYERKKAASLGNSVPPTKRVASNATELREDYRKLSTEIMEEFTRRMSNS